MAGGVSEGRWERSREKKRDRDKDRTGMLKVKVIRSCTKVKSVRKSCLLPGTWSVFGVFCSHCSLLS